MSNRGDIRSLAGHIPEPTVQRPVIEAMRARGAPMFFREIQEAAGVHRAGCIRVLSRLVKKGLVTRWKVPKSWHGFTGPAGQHVPGASVRPQYLYQLTETESGAS